MKSNLKHCSGLNVCVFLWNVLRIKEWSQAHNVPFISLWCYYIWHAAYFFGFSLSHTHTSSLSHSFTLITLAVTFFSSFLSSPLSLWKQCLLEEQSGIPRGNLKNKKRLIANTHPTVKHALSGYYEHKHTRFHTLSWDAFKWSTHYFH